MLIGACCWFSLVSYSLLNLFVSVAAFFCSDFASCHQCQFSLLFLACISASVLEHARLVTAISITIRRDTALLRSSERTQSFAEHSNSSTLMKWTLSLSFSSDVAFHLSCWRSMARNASSRLLSNQSSSLISYPNSSNWCWPFDEDNTVTLLICSLFTTWDFQWGFFALHISDNCHFRIVFCFMSAN